MAIFKGLYRGYRIYWHGAHGWGDETNASFRTQAEMHAAIDADYTRTEALLPPHDKYWDTLDAKERAVWRAKFTGDAWDRFDSVAHMAYADFLARNGGG